METTKINCPQCGAEVNVEAILSQRIEEKYRREIKAAIDAREKELKAAAEAREKELKTAADVREKELKAVADAQEKELKAAYEAREKAFKAAAEVKEQERKTKIEEDIKKKYEVELRSLKEADAEAKKKVEELQNTQVENERLKRQLDQQKRVIELEFEQKMTDRLRQETDVIRQSEKENSELKIQELKKKLEDATKLAEVMRQKAEQGSMQLQGEVQERELEKMLRVRYEMEGDEIIPIGKGVRGGDVLHKVKKSGEECGQIYYESKRTKKFENVWLQKLRDDNLTAKADILVIVTEAMPEGSNHYFYKDGVWICPFWEAEILSIALRYAILRVHTVSTVQKGRETKEAMLYNYMTGNEYMGQFGAIMEGFTAMQTSYLKERRAMQEIWKIREKQLQKILDNAASLYGAVQGITDHALPEIPLLDGKAPLLIEAERVRK